MYESVEGSHYLSFRPARLVNFTAETEPRKQKGEREPGGSIPLVPRPTPLSFRRENKDLGAQFLWYLAGGVGMENDHLIGFGEYVVIVSNICRRFRAGESDFFIIF